VSSSSHRYQYGYALLDQGVVVDAGEVTVIEHDDAKEGVDALARCRRAAEVIPGGSDELTLRVQRPSHSGGPGSTVVYPAYTESVSRA
jgi:hypothetical protein